MKVNREEAKKFATSGNFFQLKDDGDSAVVRLLFNKEEDIDNYIASVHVLEKDNRITDVDCIRSHDEPADKCPFCAERIRMQVKIYIPLWDEDRKRVLWWTRSRGFIEKVVKQIREVDGSIVGTPFKIIRIGAAGSFDTDYEFIQQAKKADDKMVEDFVDLKELNISEAGVLDLTEEQMEKYLRTGNLPQKDVKTRTEGGRDRGRGEDTGRRQVPAESGKGKEDEDENKPRVGRQR